MLASLHPCGDELELYLLNRLPAHKSVRIAEHLLLCAPCVELSAQLEESINCVWQQMSIARPSYVPAVRHPADDDLELYLLNRLPAHKSVELAQHLLSCPLCVERSAGLDDWINSPRNGGSLQTADRQRAVAVSVQPVVSVDFRYRNPVWHAGYAVAAALLLTIGLGTMLFQRTSASRVRVATSTHSLPVFSPPAVQEPAEPVQEPTVAEPVVRKWKTAAVSKKPKPQRRIPRHFVLPPKSARTHEPAYLLPVSRPVLPAASAGTVGFVRLPTDIGQFPGRPVKKVKRNPFIRFLAVIAKPFRSDRT
jgi:hypothetical protein